MPVDLSKLPPEVTPDAKPPRPIVWFLLAMISIAVDRRRQLLAERLDELKEAVLLASAPEGMAFTSGSHLQL
ncbi:DUF2345 domain-containing protein, partial [Burkholderia sp. GbtcB21]|uniref:DUF2345 domain-containing protein n=1 Tax=Burkholderia sp. GbtcB21 TaxID=2824766 RepID=UPI001C2F16EF